MNDRIEVMLQPSTDDGTAARELEELLAQPSEIRKSAPERTHIDSVLVGTLVAFREIYQPLVVYPGQSGTAAITARTTIDLLAEHIGEEVVLTFEDGDPWRPIITGRIRKPSAWPTPDPPAQIDVDADGQRMIVSVKEQLVLRCGKASITLTKAG
ncbi:MAG: DUF6484 domain-containing protein, partial [Betaproteobacteria bacterium]